MMPVITETDRSPVEVLYRWRTQHHEVGVSYHLDHWAMFDAWRRELRYRFPPTINEDGSQVCVFRDIADLDAARRHVAGAVHGLLLSCDGAVAG